MRNLYLGYDDLNTAVQRTIDRVIFLRDGRIVDQTAPAQGPESLLDADPAR